MKKRTKVILTILVISIIIVSTITGYLYYTIYSWGADGALRLTIDGDTINMTLNETPTIEYKLTNVGNTDLRVLWGYPFIRSELYYLDNNTPVRWIGPLAEPPPDSYFNNDRLIILRVHESVVENTRFSKDLWAITNNDTYGLVFHYQSLAILPHITLPYWKGRLTSNELIINVS